MAEPRPPYKVVFTADQVPAQIDQSSRFPGPNGPAANRAGYTTVRFDGKGMLSFESDVGLPRNDKLVPFYFNSVNICFRLTDFAVKVSSYYPVGSCAYKATVQHELDAHIRAPIAIMNGYRDALIVKLNSVVLPTKTVPRWIRASERDSIEKPYQTQVYGIVADIRTQVSAALKKDRADQDSASNYKTIYDKCPAVEWSRTR